MITINRLVGVVYFLFWFIIVLCDVGTTLPGSTIHWWDVIYIPSATVVMPMLIGYFIGKESR